MNATIIKTKATERMMPIMSLFFTGAVLLLAPGAMGVMY